MALEVRVQPREETLTDAEIEALSARIVAAAEKAVGAKLPAVEQPMILPAGNPWARRSR